MIQEFDVLHLLIEAYPKSREVFVSTVEDWFPAQGPISPCILLGILSHFVKSQFLLGEYDDAKALFSLIEKFVVDGVEPVRNAACTCFIENLQNYCEIDGFDGSYFIPLLGEKSKEYARGWDGFTGVRTSGLW